ncbi:Protein transport protein SEC13 [Durusdinium trenchii]|uniref:Protein transport protein SEC13 n=1 Tax=Durusdinium trenchii TaxID=1381693 RepID=A0ABP0M838_9DINO
MTAIVSQFDTAHTAPILDTQLDELCLRLATASADGLVKLWDVQSPEDPIFLCDLDGHTGPVRQASWAPVGTGAGALLLTGGDDGRVLLWGPCHDAKRWQLVHEEDLSRHGEVKAVSWAPVNVGAAFACALSDGTVTATIHQGTVRSGQSLESWLELVDFSAVDEQMAVEALLQLVMMVSSTFVRLSDFVPKRPADARSTGVVHFGCRGPERRDAAHSETRDASVSCRSTAPVWHRAWCAREVQGRCKEEEVEKSENKETLTAERDFRDVAWKPWDGNYDTLASARHISLGDPSSTWVVEDRVNLEEEVWKIEWYQAGSQLLVTCGTKEYRSILLKQQLSGKWDVIDLSGDVTSQ